MSKAEEVACEFHKWMLDEMGLDNLTSVVLINKLMEALTLFAEEKVKVALDKKWEIIKATTPTKLIMEMARNQALEEAAKVAREVNLNVHPECGRSVARTIEALKSGGEVRDE